MKRTKRAIVRADMEEIASEPLPWRDLEGRRCLVTGATGFIAAYLVEALLFLNDHVLEEPLQVIALARSADKVRSRFGHLLGRADLVPLIQDVSVPLEDGPSIDYVVHAASQASPGVYMADPVGTLAANTVGTYHLLQRAGGALQRFVFVSSGEAYGRFFPAPDKAIGEEAVGWVDHLDPRSCYAEGKRVGEAWCAAYARQFAIPAVSARLGHTYGPGMNLGDGRVFTDFVGNVVRREPIVMKSAGAAVRPFCYLTDAIRGFLVLLLRGRSGEVYNLMNDEAYYSVRELAEMLAALYRDRCPGVIRPEGAAQSPASNGLDQKIPISTAKLRQLGWVPRVTVPDGFRRTVEYFASPPDERQKCPPDAGAAVAIAEHAK